ncbi:MAG: hypothetical protein J2P48_02980 [Alphaproteobacteria bacterium]|nr:hypothetical protein [Alphaproteobacteria bacterium]
MWFGENRQRTRRQCETCSSTVEEDASAIETHVPTAADSVASGLAKDPRRCAMRRCVVKAWRLGKKKQRRASAQLQARRILFVLDPLLRNRRLDRFIVTQTAMAFFNARAALRSVV